MDDLGAITETGGAAAAELAVAVLIERGGRIALCPNCAAPLTGAFCATCGQPCETHRRSVLHLLHDFFKDIASFDSRILRTAQALMLRPGELPLAFREGRTQRYVPAVRLYLFVSLLFFLFLSVTGIALVQFDMNISMFRLVSDKAGNITRIENGVSKPMEGFKADAKGNVYVADGDESRVLTPGTKADGSVTNNVTNTARFFQRIGTSRPKLSPAAKAALAKINADASKESIHSKSKWVATEAFSMMQKLEADPAALNGPLMTWIPRILFLLLPLFALLLAAFYWRKRKEFYFVDHLVFSLTMHTFFFAILIGAAIAAQFVPGKWVADFVTATMGLYLLLSLKSFYGQNWTWTGLKFVGISLIYTLFFLTPALLAALVASVAAA